jgi:hypothetical protein
MTVMIYTSRGASDKPAIYRTGLARTGAGEGFSLTSIRSPSDRLIRARRRQQLLE